MTGHGRARPARGRVPAGDGTATPGSLAVERRLTAVLGGWAAASVLVGGALALRPATRRFGRQTVAWGVVDGVIAAAGTAGRRRRGPTDPVRLRRVLRVNLAAGVGYVAGGLAAARSRRARVRGWHADGVAVVVQGTALLALDAWAERALTRALAGAPGPRGRP